MSLEVRRPQDEVKPDIEQQPDAVVQQADNYFLRVSERPQRIEQPSQLDNQVLELVHTDLSA